MNFFIYGGTIDGKNSRVSGIVDKIKTELLNYGSGISMNGHSLNTPSFIQDLYNSNKWIDTMIWMPDIRNEEPKHYPVKKIGDVLICSKVMREDYTRFDAVSRIFKMQGNAVICIYKDKNPFKFELIDALGNIWCNTSEISVLCKAINDLYKQTRESVRLGSTHLNGLDGYTRDKESIRYLIKANNMIKEKIMESCGNRFFGNISTRCQNLFPSCSGTGVVFVSPRNCDKTGLTAEDMVPCYLENDLVYYGGQMKPSVDAPIQISLYVHLTKIKYMIHGHAFLKPGSYSFDVSETNEYRFCGDYREKDLILKAIPEGSEYGVVNLKNHGFLIYSSTQEQLNEILISSDWEMKKW
ncbi:MAG: class II aldolase/adducin family protein [Paludibacteraceae bacterium]|nr:class II aldolase/adducin family protein [Paludibacteraceae bacterium]MCK9615756.1 class II aldolase/adducin family protein [Candidatus Omnitrophota bacterium]